MKDRLRLVITKYVRKRGQVRELITKDRKTLKWDDNVRRERDREKGFWIKK